MVYFVACMVFHQSDLGLHDDYFMMCYHALGLICGDIRSLLSQDLQLHQLQIKEIMILGNYNILRELYDILCGVH